jgi:hypothetical protein
MAWLRFIWLNCTWPIWKSNIYTQNIHAWKYKGDWHTRGRAYFRFRIWKQIPDSGEFGPVHDPYEAVRVIWILKYARFRNPRWFGVIDQILHNNSTHPYPGAGIIQTLQVVERGYVRMTTAHSLEHVVDKIQEKLPSIPLLEPMKRTRLNVIKYSYNLCNHGRA